MREIIQKLIETEKAAAEIIRTANHAADLILEDAHRRASDISFQLAAEAQDEVTRLLHEAAQSAEAEKQRKFKEISAQLNTEIRMDDQTMQRAITAVIRCVCGH